MRHEKRVNNYVWRDQLINIAIVCNDDREMFSSI